MSKNLRETSLSSYDDIQILYENFELYNSETEFEICGDLYTKFKYNQVHISNILPNEILRPEYRWNIMDSNILNVIDLREFLINNFKKSSNSISKLDILRSLLKLVLTINLKNSSELKLSLNNSFSKDFSNYNSLLNYVHESFIVNQDSLNGDMKIDLYAGDFVIFIVILLNDLNSQNTFKSIHDWFNYNVKFDTAIYDFKSDTAIFDFKKGAFDNDIIMAILNYIYNWTPRLNKNIDSLNSIKSDKGFLILGIALGIVKFNRTDLIIGHNINVNRSRLETTMSQFKTINELLFYSS